MPMPRCAAGVSTTLARPGTAWPASLDAERFGHRDHQRIALLGANHRKADAGITACCLDDRLPRFELAGAPRLFENTERQAILDGPERIERLDLDVEVCVRRRQPVDLHDWRVSDCFEDILKLACHIF